LVLKSLVSHFIFLLDKSYIIKMKSNCASVIIVRFQVLMMANMKMTVFWDIGPCCFIEVHQHFRGVYCLHYLGDAWWWRQYTPLKHQSTSARLYGTIFSKAVIFKCGYCCTVELPWQCSTVHLVSKYKFIANLWYYISLFETDIYISGVKHWQCSVGLSNFTQKSVISRLKVIFNNCLLDRSLNCGQLCNQVYKADWNEICEIGYLAHWNYQESLPSSKVSDLSLVAPWFQYWPEDYHHGEVSMVVLSFSRKLRGYSL
jgi:hypothetical protein